MAGPQRRAGGRFTLRVTPGGFATIGAPALRLDGTSYGASPGNAFHAAPYAYVSSGDHDGSGFWNAPFGAIRGSEQVQSVNDLVTFWREAQALLKDGAPTVEAPQTD